MEDPVDTPYGTTYDRKFIEEWIEKKGNDPIHGKPLSKSQLKCNFTLKKTIDEWHEKTLPLIIKLKAAERRISCLEMENKEVADTNDLINQILDKQATQPIQISPRINITAPKPTPSSSPLSSSSFLLLFNDEDDDDYDHDEHPSFFSPEIRSTK